MRILFLSTVQAISKAEKDRMLSFVQQLFISEEYLSSPILIDESIQWKQLKRIHLKEAFIVTLL